MDRKTIKVICFAGLRKYFDSETEVMLAVDATFKQILEELAQLNPEAKEVLHTCRIAVNETFVPLENPVQTTNTVFLIPPSSGG